MLRFYNRKNKSLFPIFPQVQSNEHISTKSCCVNVILWPSNQKVINQQGYRVTLPLIERIFKKPVIISDTNNTNTL